MYNFSFYFNINLSFNYNFHYLMIYCYTCIINLILSFLFTIAHNFPFQEIKNLYHYFKIYCSVVLIIRYDFYKGFPKLLAFETCNSIFK